MRDSTSEQLFGHIAVHHELITHDQLAEATRIQAREDGARRLGEILVERGWLTAEQTERVLRIQQRVLAQRTEGAKRAEAPEPKRPAPRPPAPAASAPESAAPESAAPKPPPAVSDTGSLLEILAAAIERGASDIHLHSGAPLALRIDGELVRQGERPLEPEHVDELAASLLSADQQGRLHATGQVDLATAVPGLCRFRVNAYRQQRGADLVLRVIANRPPTLEELGLPSYLAKFTNYHQGLVLVTGPAGCGKTSTLAALLEIVNQERREHIVTGEDPIEFLHPSRRCLVNQRQVGRHSTSLAQILRAALREDPDVIALGDLRDLETISLALSAAETGHLVFATLHTGSAVRTINRLIGAFPPQQQEQMRLMVSESLRAVISQRLLRRADGSGRVAALEVLVVNRAVSNLIRENKTFQIRSTMQLGNAHGMRQLEQSLAELVESGVVTADEAARHRGLVQ